MSFLGRVALIVFWAATVAYIGFGIAGVLFGPYELTAFISHEPTAFNQLRFLKACELAVGASFFMLRQRIHHDPFARRFVAFVLTITPLARIAAMVADGAPILLFQVVGALEICGAVVFIAWVLETRRGTPPAAAAS